MKQKWLFGDRGKRNENEEQQIDSDWQLDFYPVLQLLNGLSASEMGILKKAFPPDRPPPPPFAVDVDTAQSACLCGATMATTAAEPIELRSLEN